MYVWFETSCAHSIRGNHHEKEMVKTDVMIGWKSLRIVNALYLAICSVITMATRARPSKQSWTFTLDPELLVESPWEKPRDSMHISCLYFGVHGIVQFGPLVSVQHQIISERITGAFCKASLVFWQDLRLVLLSIRLLDDRNVFLVDFNPI